MSLKTSPSSIAFRPRQDNVLSGTAKFPFEIHVLTGEHHRDDAYALRYRAYHASGILEDDPSGQFQDRADQFSSTAIVIAYDKGKCVGTVRICFSHPWLPLTTLPCAPYYPALKDVKRSAAGALVEVGRMAIDPDITNTSYRTTLYAALVRAGFIAAQAGGASHVLVTTKESGVGFYKAMLGFKVVGEPGRYPPGDIPITLLVGTIGEAQLKQRAQNAFFRITLDEIGSMRAALGPALARPSVTVNAPVYGSQIR
ncbi:MAG: autoinducer synthase [Hyphomicrobium sp.]|nr:MAG: autoinducer synthase [Hyphomicrobium sp.]